MLLAGILAVLYLGALPIYIYRDRQRDERVHADVIIVLGTRQDNGRPQGVFESRLKHALRLYQQHYARYLLITGGKQHGDRYTEADSGCMYATQQGIPASDILLEPRGRSTMQSLQLAQEIMRQHNLHTAILVSDPYHNFRLRRIAYDIGMRAAVSPAEKSGIRSWTEQGKRLVHETGAYALYRFTGITTLRTFR